MYPLSSPLYLYIQLYIKLHFLCIYCVRPCHIQQVISQHLFELSTQLFQYSKTHDLFSDHHLCQVAPKLQSSNLINLRSFILHCSYHENLLSCRLNSALLSCIVLTTKIYCHVDLISLTKIYCHVDLLSRHDNKFSW